MKVNKRTCIPRAIEGNRQACEECSSEKTSKTRKREKAKEKKGKGKKRKAQVTDRERERIAPAQVHTAEYTQSRDYTLHTTHYRLETTKYKVSQGEQGNGKCDGKSTGKAKANGKRNGRKNSLRSLRSYYCCTRFSVASFALCTHISLSLSLSLFLFLLLRLSLAHSLSLSMLLHPRGMQCAIFHILHAAEGINKGEGEREVKVPCSLFPIFSLSLSPPCVLVYS